MMGISYLVGKMLIAVRVESWVTSKSAIGGAHIIFELSDGVFTIEHEDDNTKQIRNDVISMECPVGIVTGAEENDEGYFVRTEKEEIVIAKWTNGTTTTRVAT